MIEQRRFVRAYIDCPLSFVVKGQTERIEGIGRDISIGGMFVETQSPAAFNTSVVVHVQLPGMNEESALPAVVRWVRNDGMGLQFGLLGVRETHAITEIARKADQ